MAYIGIVTQNMTGLPWTCGGSVINKRWILSAGHCFCEVLPCKTVRGGRLLIDFVPDEHVFVVVGLREKGMVKIKENREKLFEPEKIYIHPR